MNCQYCNNEFNSNSNLNNHQKTAKYCIKLQNKNKSEEQNELNNLFLCCCGKKYTSKKNLELHSIKCIPRLLDIEKERIKQLENEIREQRERYENEIREQRERYENQVRELQNKLENVAIKAIHRSFEDQAVIEMEIEEDNDDEHNDNEDEETKENIQDNQLSSLHLQDEFTIEHRKEDGYINVTNLCKAGKKQFKAWNRLDKTKAFLQVLSESVLISTDSLIKYNSAYGSERATWVHPQVAINIAQWISPQFDVKVSAWVYEIMMTGKIDITNTKSYRQLQEENKTKDLKIQYLTKKYVKRQRRLQIQEKNIIYILTTHLLKQERRYILGKATDLTDRLSTYNKTDEHEIIYYQQCPNEESMKIIETLVFSKLQEYREQANRERFILPENQNIDMFINTIKECINFVC